MPNGQVSPAEMFKYFLAGKQEKTQRRSQEMGQLMQEGKMGGSPQASARYQQMTGRPLPSPQAPQAPTSPQERIIGGLPAGEQLQAKRVAAGVAMSEEEKKKLAFAVQKLMKKPDPDFIGAIKALPPPAKGDEPDQYQAPRDRLIEMELEKLGVQIRKIPKKPWFGQAVWEALFGAPARTEVAPTPGAQPPQPPPAPMPPGGAPQQPRAPMPLPGGREPTTDAQVDDLLQDLLRVEK